jgi:hypothetical protein
MYRGWIRGSARSLTRFGRPPRSFMGVAACDRSLIRLIPVWTFLVLETMRSDLRLVTLRFDAGPVPPQGPVDVRAFVLDYRTP